MSEVNRCPVDHDLMKQLYEDNGPIQQELKDIVTPLATLLADRILSDTAEYDPVTTWSSASPDLIYSGLPYGDNLWADPYVLPPHLFGSDTGDIDLTVPNSSEDRTLLTKNFLANRPQLFRRYAYAGDEQAESNIKDVLRAVYIYGVTVDPDTWGVYKAAADVQRSEFYHLEVASTARDQNVKSMLSSKGSLVEDPIVNKFRTYMYTSTDTLVDPSFTKLRTAATGFIYMPIGEYGEDFSKNLLKLTQYAVERAEISCGEYADELAEGHETVIRTNMARGKYENEERTPGEALVASLQEGVLTISQTIALMTAQRVEGYDNPIALVKDIVDGGLIEQFTRAVPMGVVGPFILGGRYFDKLVIRTDRGLRLNPEVMGVLKEYRTQQIVETAQGWAERKTALTNDIEPEAAYAPSSLGIPCPAAFAHGAITELNHAMLSALEGIGNNPRQQRAGIVMARKIRPVAALVN